MLDFIAIPMGWLMRVIYNIVAPLDTKYLSAYAISIILATIVVKLLMLPLTLKQTKSMKVMQDMAPRVKELQDKYGKDPQTLQRKQMELYKEANYNPLSGCLPMLIQLPLIMAFFYVIQQPVKYVFGGDQAVFELMNKSFLWIKDLGFAAGHVFESGAYSGMVNGFNMGFSLPFIGSALPILAAISAYTTYMTSKMSMNTQMATMNEQQKSTQNMMTMMMPIMIFVMSIGFPSGLVLYWVVGNIFQLVQQWLILNSSKKVKEE